MVFLTDKNILVFNGIEHDAYIYLPCQKNTNLQVIYSESMRESWFAIIRKIYRSILRDIRREFWKLMLELFPADFLLRILYRYYLNYEERLLAGRETTNISRFVQTDSTEQDVKKLSESKI